MSDALEHLRGGDPDAALAALQSAVRAAPAEAKHRVFLFQLLAVQGQWDRALTQLNVAGELDAGTLGMVQVYREALGSEALRAEVFAGRRSPLIFGEPEQWVALLLEALRLTASGDYAGAEGLRNQAFEQAPTVSGRINGEPFEWIADADSRLGPVVEIIVNGRYYWVPFHRIVEMRLERPADLRDLVWLPVEIKWSNGGEAVGLVPSRYPGSETAADPSLRLARRTEWTELAAGLFVGRGQRMFATDAAEYPVMEIETLSFETPDAAVEAEDGTAAMASAAAAGGADDASA
ncbi:MAG TPA: type VI secretion system accessory protein TagJ [Gammaproteobacteria bacterium]|nr:type VI secretion system accessory protein TagJ [Gammaproteobacteria bacterium]